MKIEKFASLLLFALLSNIAWCNDSTARIGAGGLELLKNDSIQMQRELLIISKENVEVNYEFYNKSNNAIETLVAFPMPIYHWNYGESQYENNIGPINKFSTYVQSKRIATKSIFKAILNGKDINQELANLGITEPNNFGDCKLNYERGVLCNLSTTQINKLIDMKAMEKNSHDAIPIWDVEQTQIWTQVFPAATTLKVTHSYPPLTGGNYRYPLLDGEDRPDDLFHAAAVSKNNSEACIDDSFKKAYLKKISTLKMNGAKTIEVFLDDVEYILGTGRNWADPIGDFTLRIKKTSEDQLVSLCFPGTPKKIDSLTIEFNHRNFIPQDKLIVYFYSFRAE